MKAVRQRWIKATVLAVMLALPIVGGTGLWLACQRAFAAERDVRRTAEPSSARFEVSSEEGRVVRIVMQPAARSERYVFDQFVESADEIAEERARRAAGPLRPSFCAALSLDARRCQRSCAWAESARAFTRVSRLRADGSRQVLSRSDQVPLRFNAGAASHTSRKGDCLSPDGRYLSVIATPDGASQFPLPRIVELAVGLPEVRFNGSQTQKAYGEDRFFDFTGWMPGAQHTLTFSYGGDEPFDDEGGPTSRSGQHE